MNVEAWPKHAPSAYCTLSKDLLGYVFLIWMIPFFTFSGAIEVLLSLFFIALFLFLQCSIVLRCTYDFHTSFLEAAK